MKKLSYCFHCKKPTSNKREEIVSTKNSRSMMKSICTVCGHKKSIFISGKKKAP